ncbi:Rne/Rng family ribonuclease [Rickettsiaceae bacterium]|nr:Rne/Rng family ribonuclease [Rickettsiaceae bacterium]
MKKRIIIDANFPTETRVSLLDKNNNIENIEFSYANKENIKGNIYLAKITRVEPSLQAAFVDYGEDKSGFLPFNEIHSNYYHVPSTDKKTDSFIGDKIVVPEITSEDLAQDKKQNKLAELANRDEIDIKTIEKMVDEGLGHDINIEAEESEIDSFDSSSEKIENEYKIQEVIKKGQVLLVQVTKEERGNKGASLTTYISLAGKYCVLMPNKSSQHGISRKISNTEERKRLKKIVNNIGAGETNGASVIARTAGVGRSTLEIKKDYDCLAKLWNKIREVTLKSQAPAFIHQEDGIIRKTIRDMFDINVKEIVVQGKEAFNSCLKFMEEISPKNLKTVREYKGKVPIYTKFAIEDQLIKLYQPVVSLPSGGYIVIHPTEALISIDVNSGRATGERNVEKMALTTNMEAAREIAKQSRLRDLSGLLVIDFIDLNESKNRKMVERSLWEYFSKDKARIQTSPISVFGLLEISRQRLHPSFLEMNSSMCSHCSGKGVTRSNEPNAMLILRTIENEIYNGKFDSVNVYGIASSIIYLLNNKRMEIDFIEKKYSIKLNFLIDRDATSDSYSIEKIKASNKSKTDTVVSTPAIQDVYNIYQQEENSPTETEGEKRKINKVRKKTSGNPSRDSRSIDDKSSDEETFKDVAQKDNSEKETKTRKKIAKKNTSKVSHKKKLDESK